MDKKQLKALELIKEGVKLVNISEDLNLSINVVKKLSRLDKMYKQLEDLKIDEEYIEMFKNMNFKALELSNLIKSKDVELIKEVIQATKDIKNTDIKTIVEDVKNKKNDVDKLKNEIENRNQEKKDIKNKLKKIEKQAKTSNKLEYELFFKSNLEENILEFFKTHIKKDDTNYFLVKRVVPSFQTSLKNKKIIELIEYEWQIHNLRAFVEQCCKRFANNKPVLWKDWSKFKNSAVYCTPYKSYYVTNDTYKNYDFKDVLNIFNDIETLKNLKIRLKEIDKEIKDLKTVKTNTYKQNTYLVNKFSANDIEKHRLMQDVICKHYYNKNYIAIPELSVNKFRFDCFCYNRIGNIEIVEVKNSRNDFKNDNKYLNYLNYCNKLYFALNKEIKIEEKDLERLQQEGVGLLTIDLSNSSIEMLLEANKKDLSDDIRKELIKKCNDCLFKKITARK